jgi:hypothetical protein
MLIRHAECLSVDRDGAYLVYIIIQGAISVGAGMYVHHPCHRFTLSPFEDEPFQHVEFLFNR